MSSSPHMNQRDHAGEGQPQTPITPGTANSSAGTNDVSARGAACTPILDGPASIDLERPMGQKRAKSLRGRKKQQFSDAQHAASQTFRAGLASLQAASNARWEKSKEEQRQRDEISNQVLQEDRRMVAREHDLNVVERRARIAKELESLTERLVVAVQRVDAISPESLVTPNQLMAYEARQDAVALLRAQRTELMEALGRTRYESPVRPEPVYNNSTAGPSQRQLHYEGDVTDLGID